MSYDNRGRGSRGHRQDRGYAQPSRLDTSAIVLQAQDNGALDPELFNTVAHQIAKTVAGDDRNQKNKPTQLRQFYDELVMWEEKTRQDEQRFLEYLPFIRMLNAKAAYAKGRNHVDQNFVDLVSHCVGQVKSPATLRNFKLFFEAFMGFYKLYKK